ncbi:hypothetical protein FUT84_03560 [Treponema phagedenis]|uniref:Uncharacterized protein n=1 Tax=Treponema phagedenis TaxID=162 RepID=A0AAE6IS15_TREPH|nr:hypothetical protein FUT82_04360 [Treponema phagedenis]QEK00340.1 hypothetical protein FUT84_03560 [Treponema phagedenis]QEK02511.1 hypothetical protein FUT83_00960 [Treponema phagedenis]QEK08141.1 hypothetical protein FUT81_00960 [Treponema phagedenis]
MVNYNGRQNSERARTPVVPNRNDVLKQSNLQSFKTRGLVFDTDGKTQYCHGWQWFHAELSLKTTTAYSEFSNS